MPTLLLVNNYGPSLIGFRWHLIKTLVEHGVRVVACAPDISHDVKVQLLGLGAEVVEYPLARAGMNPVSDLSTFWALFKLMRQVRPEISLAFAAKPVIYGTLAATLARVPRRLALIEGLGYAFVERETSTVRHSLLQIVLKTMYRVALWGAHKVFFLNKDDVAAFIGWNLVPSSKVVNIGSIGLDIEHYAPAPLPEKPAFLMIGRLLGDKGVREYAEAALLLKARHPDVPVRLVGWLDENPDSITQAEFDRMIAGGVEFLGRLDDVRPAIAAASVYVLPSYREGTPRSTLEAMAMGRAIVTTDAPGCRETVEDGVNGFLVPVRDSQALAAAMEKFILDVHLAFRMGSESRRIAVQKYDVNLVNAEIMRHAGLL